MVNGMHIYGWPISAKLADSDWNNRRNPPVGGIETGWPNRKYRTEKLVRRDRYEVQHRFVNQQDNRSFVEVVKEDRSGEKGRKDDKVVPSKILVKSGKRDFRVRLEEPLIPVSSEWLSRRLGLKSELKNKINQEDDGGECCGASGEGEWGLVERCQGKSNRAGGMNAGLRKSNEKEENIGV
ncbi:hypothetical protein Q3G72_005036 [Acer saccharum]|nr:hypothetical protein Q3G72_005036 [Acer saccharum]